MSEGGTPSAGRAARVGFALGPALFVAALYLPLPDLVSASGQLVSAGHAERAAGQEPSLEQMQPRLAAAWSMYADENRVLGAIARRSQTLIEERVSRQESADELIAVEVRSGKAYVVRRGEDRELDQLVFELEGIARKRKDFVTPR